MERKKKKLQGFLFSLVSLNNDMTNDIARHSCEFRCFFYFNEVLLTKQITCKPVTEAGGFVLKNKKKKKQ